MPDSPMANQVVFIDHLTNRMSVAQGFFRWFRLQKYLGPRRHSLKKIRFRRQAINLTPPRRVRVWKDSPWGSLEIDRPAWMPDSPLKSNLHEVGTDRAVFVDRPTNRMSMAQGFFWWVQAQGRSPDVSGCSQNASGPVGILLKRGAIGARRLNPASPSRVTASGFGPLRLEDAGQRAPRPNTTNNQDTPNQIRVCPNTADRSVKWLGELASYSQWETYRYSLTFMQIRQINLPVSLHLSKTNGSYAPSRSCTFSCDRFIFGVTLLSLSLSRISFSGRSRSVPYWTVI